MELPMQTGCERTGFQREKSHWGEPDILSHTPLETSFDIKADQGRGQEVEQEAVIQRLRSPALSADMWGWGGKDWCSEPTAQEEQGRAFQASPQEANFIVIQLGCSIQILGQILMFLGRCVETRLTFKSEINI